MDLSKKIAALLAAGVLAVSPGFGGLEAKRKPGFNEKDVAQIVINELDEDCVAGKTEYPQVYGMVIYRDAKDLKNIFASPVVANNHRRYAPNLLFGTSARLYENEAELKNSRAYLDLLIEKNIDPLNPDSGTWRLAIYGLDSVKGDFNLLRSLNGKPIADLEGEFVYKPVK
jgi:hypothetical protein